MKIPIAVAIFFLFFIHNFSNAQEKNKYEINLRLHYGFIMKHSLNMAHLANQRPWGLEAELAKQTRGEKLWQQLYNFPKVGYSFTFFKMDPSKPLGNSYALLLYMEKPIVKFKNSELKYRLGIGPGLIFKRFDLQNNYKNNLISSRFNYALNARLTYAALLKNRYLFSVGIGLLHFSNGAIKTPNLGINTPAAFVGIGLAPKKSNGFIKDSLSSFKRYWNLNILIAGGLKETKPPGGAKYFSSTISTYASRHLNRKSALTAGIDFFYDASPKRFLSKDSVSLQYLGKAGTVFGHELFIHRLSMLTQIGYYLYDPLKLNKRIYQRFTLKYSFNKKLFASIGLKTHFGNADYVEWGIGITL